MYLKLTTEYRLKTTDDLERFWRGELEDPPQIPTRLAKIPPGYKILADQGFDGDNLSYPNFNYVITPVFLTKNKDGQFSMDDLKRDRNKSELRYTCKVVYTGVVSEKVLRGVIPNHVTAHIDHANSWAHGHSNL